MKRITLAIILTLILALDTVASTSWSIWPKTSTKVKVSGTDVYFDFPAPPDTANYLLKPFTTPIFSSVTASFSLTMDPGAFFTWCGAPCGNPCPDPAKTRLYLEQLDPPTCDWNDPETPCQYHRWWSNPVSQELVAGDFMLAVPLTPDQWSSVYGRFGTYDATAMAAFYTALQNLNRIGMSFGGGCFFGHGVSVAGGNARFTLHSYTAQ